MHPSVLLAGLGPVIAKFSARRTACAVVAALSFPCHPAGSQELPIEVPQADGPSYRECRVDLDSAYARQTAAIRKKIETLDAGIADIKKLRAELLDNKTFLGVGPEASTNEAMEIAQILRNTKTICDVATTMYEALNPGTGALGTYVAGQLTRKNIYNFLKAGQTIEALGSSKSAAELTWAVATNLVPLPPTIALAASVGENLKAGYENHKAWEDYRDELRVAVARLDRDFEVAQNRIKAEERKIYVAMRAGFDDFCAEESPPRALDDRFSARSGETVVFPITSNDRDPDGGRVRALTAGAASSDKPLRGRVSIDNSQQFSGMLRYVAPADFVGVETIRYSIVDDEGATATALVAIEVRPDGSTSPATKPKSAGTQKTGASTAADGDVDLDAIWARCENSPDVERCIDDNLRGASATTETGREHSGCQQAHESILADEKELQRLSAEAATSGGSAQASMRQQLAREQIGKIRARIDATRADARKRWGCQ